MSNCSPKKEPNNGSISFTYEQCPPPEEGPPVLITLTFNYIEKYWYEVRPPSSTRKLITNGSKQEKLKKSTIQIPDPTNSENEAGDVVNFIDQVFYQQEYEFVGSGNDIKSRPVFEKYCKADTVYDDQYFYHVFEWPPTHTIEPRPVGGISVTPPTPPDECPVYQVESTTVSGTLTLNKVDSQVFGVPENSIVYHGGTDNDKIFFFYESTSNQDFIAVGDVINGWTVTKVVNYNAEHFDQKSIRTTESVRRRISKMSDKNVTPSYIFINNNDNSDRLINVGDRVIGKGIQKDTFVERIQGLKIFLTKPLVYKHKKDVRNARFENTSLANNISDKILCYAEISGGGASFVKDTFYRRNSGNIVTESPTSTVYHVFDDTRNKNIQFTASRDVNINPKSEGDSGGNNDSENRKHYTVTFLDNTTISKPSDIQILFSDNQTASGVATTSRVSKIEIVDSKKFNIWFKRNDTNENTYVRGWRIKKVPGGADPGSNRIKVVAGKGIADRSAVCGVYVSNDKKYFSYTPLFYAKDSFCESTELNDSLGKFVLGSVILEDNSTFISQKFLCVGPSDDDGYQINNIFWTYFNRPAELSELAGWINKYKETDKKPENFLELRKQIVDFEKARLNGKKVLSVKDSECDNTITPNYLKVYYPYTELKDFDDKINPIIEFPEYDPCVQERSNRAYTTDELRRIITSNLSNVNLPKEMYDRIIGDEDSLQNTLLNAVTVVSSSIPNKTTIPNMPPQIEGENKSSKIFITESAHRIPPRFKSLEYVIQDFRFSNDIGFVPDAEENNIKIQIKSIPRWTGSLSPSSGDGWISNVNTTNGFIDTITISAAPFAPPIGIIPGFPAPPAKSWVAGPAPTTIWHGIESNYQATFQKVLNFRVNEVSKILSSCAKNKGNPYMDSPPVAKLSQDLGPSDTTINVDDTSQFISSGYVIIPRYIIKKEINAETKNETLRHYYLGEEIIYYRAKNDTQFLNCTREMFDTSNDFEEFVNCGYMEEGITYIIKSLGSVDWKSYGAPDNFAVGTIFTATKDGSFTNESGEVYLFESSLTPFEGNDFIIHSYEKNGYMSQYWPIEIQNK